MEDEIAEEIAEGAAAMEVDDSECAESEITAELEPEVEPGLDEGLDL